MWSSARRNTTRSSNTWNAVLKRRLEARMDDPTHSLRGGSVCDVAEEEGSQNAIRDSIHKTYEASAFVSIMQGCNMRCSFCIVPDTHGEGRGRPHRGHRRGGPPPCGKRREGNHSI